MVEVAASASRQAWDVAALLLAAGDTLQARFGAVVVRGELSGLTRAGSGHCYFTLKDMSGASAALRCVMFRRAAALLSLDPVDGQQVELRGRLSVYEARGDLQLVVESMQCLGAGALYEQFLRLRARLEAAGLFDASRKRAIATWPAALGIVTSTGGAALHDVLATLQRRAPHLRLIVYPSPVQGGDAPAGLVRALRLAAARREVDTLLLVRGGGSLEDLWAFNDEALVRAIADSPIPVISGVGHESDVTLADLAADLRAATPTAAAELAAPARRDALAQLQALAERLQRRVHHLHDSQMQRLDSLTVRLGAPTQALTVQRQALVGIAGGLRSAVRHAAMTANREPTLLGLRLRHAVHTQIERLGQRSQALTDRLAALDPQQVLARGYAWVTDGQGRPVCSARAVSPGAQLGVVWADGSARVEVRQVQPRDPASPTTP